MNVVSKLILADPVAPATIWAVLLFLSLPALLLLASPQAVRNPRLAALDALGLFHRYRQDQARSRHAAAEAVRYADEIQVAAARAHDAAHRWQEHLQQAEQHAGAAWESWQRAEQRLTRARAAAAFAAPGDCRTPQEYADRERFLHRSLRTAVERGDLPVSAPAAAFAGRDGWDARLHPVEQELVLLRAVADHRRQLCRQAAAAERAARHDAELALSARDSLRAEAAAAGDRAGAVRRSLPATAPEFTPASRRSLIRQVA